MPKNGPHAPVAQPKEAAPVPAPQQAPPPAVPPPPRKQPQVLKSMLEQAAQRLAEVLPKHLTPERMIHVVSTLNFRTPDLQDCDPRSILSAVMQSAALGLDLSPTMGEGYLIPRWNKNIGAKECHFQPGYRGLIKLARNSGAVVSIRADLVYASDVFRYRFTPELEFIHEPYLGPDRGEVTHVYAVAKLPSGEYQVEPMTRAEVESIRQRSQTPNAGPWRSDWGEMARKTPLKRLLKRFPMSVELADAVDADNAEYEVPGSPGEVTARVAPRRGLAGLSSRLQIEEPALPPQPSRVYTEADDEVQEDARDDEPGADEAREGEAGEKWEQGRE